MPGGLNHFHAFWDELILRDHPQKEQLMPYLRERVSVFDFLKPEFQGKSRSEPYRPEAFQGSAFPNRIPDEYSDFVRNEVRALVRRGCLVT